jgi:transglutaminase-like putative cysteine protease
VIKASVESVAGNVKVNVSQAVNIQQNRQESFQQQENLRVGNGPNRTLSDRPLWEYESSGGTNYLRTTVFDEFTGSGWKRGFEGAYAQAYQWIADPSEFEFRVRRLTPMSTLPSPGEVLQWREQRSVRRLTDGTFAAEGRGERSEFNGIGIEPRDRSIYVNSLCDEFLGTPLMIPGPLPDRVKRFVDETILGAKTDREKAERIVQAVSSLVKYNINAVAITNGENAVDEFLFETKEGYCDLFATAMTVCARHAGLPARYVQGFLPDVQNRDGAGRQLILEKDYHAWCEILFEDAGWVVFDATAYAESVPGGERGRATSSVPFWETSAARQMLDSGVVGLVVVAFVVAIYLRVRPSGEALKRREIDRVALEFVRVLEKATKQRRRLSQTLLEFADSLANTLPKEKLSPDKVAATQRIAKEITQRMYGPSKVEESDLRSLRQEINRLKGELKKST